jgi:hypothetical protein
MRLGFTAVPTPEPFSFAASSLISPLVNLISSIGAGREEADVIVPNQEELGRYLGQVDQWLKQPLSVSQLQQIYGGLVDYWSQFKQWLFTDFFTSDGDTRASEQSVDTMEWQVNARLQTIQQMLAAMGVQLQPPITTQNDGRSISSLSFRQPGGSWFPQAGTLPPVNTLLPPGTQPAGYQTASMSPLLVAGLAAAAGFLIFGRGQS